MPDDEVVVVAVETGPTEEVANKIIGYVMDGASKEDAAGAVSIHHSTLFRWQRRGRDAIAARARGDEPRTADDVFVLLAKGLHDAQYKAKVEAVRTVRKAMLGYTEAREVTTEEYDASVPADAEGQQLRVTKRVTTRTEKFEWTAAMTWLERRYPREWARLVRQELSGPDGDPIPIEEHARSLARQAEDFLRRRADLPDDDEEDADPLLPYGP